MAVDVKTFASSGEAAAALSSDRGARYLGGGTLVMRALNEGDIAISTIVRAHDSALMRLEASGPRVTIGDMEAPIVVAKGKDFLAQEIKEVARWHGITVLENPPLAQALYHTVEVGSAIPSALYTAVTEILAFVFRAQAQARQQAARAPVR